VRCWCVRGAERGGDLRCSRVREVARGVEPRRSMESKWHSSSSALGKEQKRDTKISRVACCWYPTGAVAKSKFLAAAVGREDPLTWCQTSHAQPAAVVAASTRVVSQGKRRMKYASAYTGVCVCVSLSLYFSPVLPLPLRLSLYTCADAQVIRTGGE
jgi:hypothetical protein